MTMFEVGGNMCNNAFQLAMQQCCVASRRKMLPVLPDLKGMIKKYIINTYCTLRNTYIDNRVRTTHIF